MKAMKPLCATLFATLAAVGCGDTTTTGASQLNLDRPVDVAFACYGGLRITGNDGAQPADPTVVSPMPRQACDIYSRTAVEGSTINVPVGQEDLRAAGGSILGSVSWYGLILQSATGSVALAQFDTKPTEQFQGGDTIVLDTDPLTPGKNGISVGVEPIALTVDDSGCFAITANAGSCDASILNLTDALAREPKPTVTRAQVKNASGVPIAARAAAMIAATGDSVIGQACPANPTGIVYIAYPNCHMVAAVNVETLATVASITFDAAGVPQVGDGNVTCPAECNSAGPVTPGVRPVTLDIRQDARVGTRRMVIGADNSASITMVELDASLLPVSVSRVAFEDRDNDLGVHNVALSPQLGLGGAVGVVNDAIAPGGQAQFVYAVASDGTVRVAEVLNLSKECDTQVDPRLLAEERDIARLSCLPVGDALTPRRRALARGPGIELTGDAVPTAVTFVTVDNDGTGAAAAPRQLIGHFAAIAATTGSTFIVNIDDDNFADLPIRSRPLESPLPFVMAHQLRDALADRAIVAESSEAEPKPICITNGPDPADTTGNRGGPRLTANPTQLVSTTTIAPEKALTLPFMQQVLCEGSDENRPVSQLSFAAPVAVRAESFPDLRALRSDETWSLTFEGSLSLDRSDNSIDGPAVRTGLMTTSNGALVVSDPAKPYCSTGVEPFDIVQMRGCDPTASTRQCAFGYECVLHPDSAFNVGACLPTADKATLLDTCRDFMVALRRYSVSRTSAGEVAMVPRLRQLRTTPLSGCTSAQQCTDLALVQAKLGSASHPKDDTTVASDRAWACEVDPSRATVAPACVMTCTEDKNCDSGTVCQNNRCVEGVVPPPVCVAGPQRFELRAGAAFTVVGTRSGFIHNVIADASGACIQNPTGNALLRGRIPLVAPPCTDIPTPNPCSTEVMQTERQPRYVAGSCVAADPSSALVTRPAKSIRFSNPGMTFNIVDPTYPGDALCRGDRAGGLVDVPMLYAGYALNFRQTAGFTPLVLGIQPSYPSKVIAGPTQSIWVVDEGDFLSESAALPSTRGKVFRVEGQSLGTINIMQ